MNAANVTLEHRLVRALALDPQTSTLDALNDRVGRAIAQLPRERAPRWRLRVFSRPGLALILLAVLAGGAVAGTGIVSQLAQSAPAFASAWERATLIDQTRTVNGHAVTVERVYVDENQILVGMTAQDQFGKPADLGRVELRVDGVGDARGLVGIGDANRVTTAEVLSYATPEGVGEEVAMTLIAHSLPATFRFRVPNSGGSTVEPDALDQAAGVSVTLHRLTISPTVISGRIAFAGAPIEQGEAWVPVGSISSGETRGNFSSVQPVPDNRRLVTFRTVVGSETPEGTWTVRIDEIVGHRNGEQIRLAGPWAFDVKVED